MSGVDFPCYYLNMTSIFLHAARSAHGTATCMHLDIQGVN